MLVVVNDYNNPVYWLLKRLQYVQQEPETFADASNIPNMIETGTTRYILAKSIVKQDSQVSLQNLLGPFGYQELEGGKDG